LVIDLRADAAAEATLQRMLTEHSRRPFDLATGPLIRVVAWKLAAEQHVILLVMHHIISDGWSMAVMMREITAHYRAHRSGMPVDLPPLPVTYRDYAAWQAETLRPAHVEPTLRYWRQTLAGANETLDLPIDFPRPRVQRFEG